MNLFLQQRLWVKCVPFIVNVIPKYGHMIVTF